MRTIAINKFKNEQIEMIEDMKNVMIEQTNQKNGVSLNHSNDS